MGVGGKRIRRHKAVVFVEGYPFSASVFAQGTLVVGVAIPGEVFGEAVSKNNRIPLVLLASRKESNCSRHDCNNDWYLYCS